MYQQNLIMGHPKINSVKSRFSISQRTVQRQSGISFLFQTKIDDSLRDPELFAEVPKMRCKT